MANPEHLAKLKEGVEAWNNWRTGNPGVHPVLAWPGPSLNLSGARLGDANLSGTDLSLANLINADLSGANLMDAHLSRASLLGANLRGANLIGANLFLAQLNSADLSDANLTLVNFFRVELDKTNLSGAIASYTHFGDCDLSTAKGLTAVKHEGPSTVGIDTIYRSKGIIPESFLRGAGVPENFITFMRSLTEIPIEFYSCFISYSSRDDAFVTELHTKLQAEHIRCWKDSEDLKIGDKFQDVIENAIRLHDKLLVVLSENSVKSPWVEREVQAAFEKEQRQRSTVLFPVRLDDAVMDCPRAWAADIRRTRHIGDFRKWKNHDSFQKSLDRLLRDLKPVLH